MKLIDAISGDTPRKWWDEKKARIVNTRLGIALTPESVFDSEEWAIEMPADFSAEELNKLFNFIKEQPGGVLVSDGSDIE